MTFEEEDAREKRLQTYVEREVKHGIANAIQPYIRQIADLEADTVRAKKNADDDRKRIIAVLTTDVEKIAEDVAEKVVGRILEKFGLDPKKADDFRKLVDWLDDLQKTIRDARKHGITVIVGAVVLIIGSWVWTAFKTSILK